MKKILFVLVIACIGYFVYLSTGSYTAKTDNQIVTVGQAPELVKSARNQIGITRYYDPAYVALSYPNGDVSLEKGVCTDVVIRALRDAHQIDLQKEIHEDMEKDFSAYPDHWGLTSPDANIDHRRVPNIQSYFSRMGYALPISDNPADYQPGDIVSSMIEGRPHIMIVGNKQTSSGVPYVIHNVGRGTEESNFLFRYPITGHYRVL